MSLDITILEQEITVIINEDETITATIEDTYSSPIGMMIYRGEWDASGGVLPTPAPRMGYVYRLNPGGEVPYLGGTVSLQTGTLIMALINSPGQNMVNYTPW